MGVSPSAVQQLLFGYVQEIFKRSRPLTLDTRICGDLGLCDEDLWELIDHVFDTISVAKPSGADPAIINIQQRDITFGNLTEWIVRYASGLK